jgi:hypothetical protein
LHNGLVGNVPAVAPKANQGENRRRERSGVFAIAEAIGSGERRPYPMQRSHHPKSLSAVSIDLPNREPSEISVPAAIGSGPEPNFTGRINNGNRPKAVELGFEDPVRVIEYSLAMEAIIGSTNSGNDDFT